VSEKIEVLDLIIRVLREHEKNLDDAIQRLEGLVKKVKGGEKR